MRAGHLAPGLADGCPFCALTGPILCARISSSYKVPARRDGATLTLTSSPLQRPCLQTQFYSEVLGVGLQYVNLGGHSSAITMVFTQVTAPSSSVTSSTAPLPFWSLCFYKVSPIRPKSPSSPSALPLGQALPSGRWRDLPYAWSAPAPTPTQGLRQHLPTVPQYWFSLLAQI